MVSQESYVQKNPMWGKCVSQLLQSCKKGLANKNGVWVAMLQTHNTLPQLRSALTWTTKIWCQYKIQGSAVCHTTLSALLLESTEAPCSWRAVGAEPANSPPPCHPPSVLLPFWAPQGFWLRETFQESRYHCDMLVTRKNKIETL